MWAHSVNSSGRRHPLAEHLRGTAALAGGFGAGFGAEGLCHALGLLHDAGKAATQWQEGLLRVEGTSGTVGVPHKDLGARALGRRAGPLAGCVLGHHGGLLDLGASKSVLASGPGAADDATLRALIGEVPEIAEVLGTSSSLIPDAWRRDPMVAEMGMRLAFSALVDADYLDTAAHFEGRPAGRVRDPVAMSELLARFEEGRRRLLEGRPSSPVDGLRNEVFDAAVEAAAGRPGIYRLPAPTGSGKTLAAAAFGLHHAARHGMRRVIVAVPYLTITEQNAQVYRELLGDDVVLEHHSMVAPERRVDRLGAENWDAPFVVTTTVQLFDSLFGRKPARSRKVHRLAGAVVILDEVQSLPHDLLLPILDALKVLCTHFGTTVLLASATQPSFQRLSAWEEIRDDLVEVIAEPAGLYQRLRRVRYEWRLGTAGTQTGRPTLEDVAAEVAGHAQALVVVNTIGDARRMFRLLDGRCPGEALHLSARMCVVHRRHVLARVRNLLAAGEPVTVVSTQLIEAGVDVDFPVVFRAIAPAESLQQAAGRANREGRRDELGLVVVFDAADSTIPPFYRVGVGQTRLTFGPDVPGQPDPDDLAALDRYYRGLYLNLNVEGNARARSIQHHREQLDFESVADGPRVDPGAIGSARGGRDRTLAFRMLADDSVPVAVAWPEAPQEYRVDLEALLEGLRVPEHPHTMGVFRALQPHLVSLPQWVVDRADVQALLRPVVGDLWEWRGEYHPALGIDDGDTAGASVW